MSFVHLHVYSSYSLLSSTATIEELVLNAKKKGFKAIAITDQNVMYGTIAFYKACMKAQIKPIIGLTVLVQSEQQEGKSFPLVLLAKNQQGFHNLLKISSAVQTTSLSGIPLKWLRAYSGGLIAITPGLKGEIEDNIANGDIEEAKQCTKRFLEIFTANHFYYSLQNHRLHQENVVNEKLIQLSEELQIKVVATNEVHYLEQEDSFAHECLLSIKNGNKLQEEDREKLENDQFYLKTINEMVELFSNKPDALENSIHIAEQCNVMIELNTMNLPKYPTKDKGSEELLEELCLQGFHERYRAPTEEYKKRLSYELDIIKKMKFADYFLIVWDFMKFSRENGILTGPGRGSAAGSMVAYVLYITDVDPIEHGLLFERFLNPERISMPDIDIDFPDHRRDEVIEYVSRKYGKLHVAQIITFGTLAAKAVMRDLGRVFGFSTKDLDFVSKMIPSRPGTTLKTALAESEELRNFTKESSLNKRLFEVASKLEGLPRHSSTHAAGVVLTEHPLVESIPIQAGHNETYLTQYTMDHLEEVGLLKMDFLGLRNLSLIETIIDSIHRKTGKKLEIKEIPLKDEATFELLSKGETTGVFQLESDGMRNVLRKLKPTHFEDIVAVNALYRPGPMENIPLYINRKHGLEPVIYPHPDLQAILESTYGVIVYQEQIMQIAAKMAGFSLGEADLLRRAVSKKKKHILDKEREHFVQGALRKGYDGQTAHAIYDLIVKFANYGFNRSHAVAYSMIAYQLAYLKTHYPQYFMAALLSSVSGSEGKIAQYIRELKEMEITVLPPSINYSGYSFLAEKEGIRYSLAAIKGVGVAALKEIFQARKKKKFTDLFDFCLRVPTRAVNRKVLEALVHSGSFDEFGLDRAVLLASLDVATQHAQLVNPNELGDSDLFADEEEFFIKPKYVDVDPIAIEDKLRFEKEVIGIFLSNHPVTIYEKDKDVLGVSDLLSPAPERKNKRALVNITEIRKIRTKKGEAMAFLTVSDQSGEMDAVAFPNVYKRFMVLLQKGSIILIEGKIEMRDEKQQFVIQSAFDVKDAIEDIKNRKGTLYIKIEKEKETNQLLVSLKDLIRKYKGSIEIILFYESTERSIRLGLQDRINPTSECLQELKTLLGQENVIMK